MYKVVTISPYPPLALGYGGIIRSTAAYLKALSELEVQLDHISPTSSIRGEITADAMAKAFPKVTWHSYRVIGAEKDGLSLAKRWGGGIGFFRHIGVILRADTVFLHGALSLPTTLGAMLCRIFRKRYFVVSHASLDVSRMEKTYQKRKLFYGIIRPVMLWACGRAAGVVVTGKLERDVLPPSLSSRPVIEIENFLDFSPEEPEMPAHDGPGRTYLFVGRLESDKGILRFMKIWQQASAPDSRLKLIGSGFEAYAEEVRALAAADPRMDYLGELPFEKVAAEMKAADVIVLPTGLDAHVTENFGNVVLESFIKGRPAMVSEGLHLDKYADSPAVFRFALYEAAVATCIRKFDSLSTEEYRNCMQAASKLALHFHISEGVRKLRQLVSL